AGRFRRLAATKRERAVDRPLSGKARGRNHIKAAAWYESVARERPSPATQVLLKHTWGEFEQWSNERAGAVTFDKRRNRADLCGFFRFGSLSTTVTVFRRRLVEWRWKYCTTR